SGSDYCETLKEVADEYILLSYKIEEQRAADCGGEPPNSQ
nr:C-terminally located anterior lobe peptide, CALP=neuropeptide [Lymnaea stagnalis=snails, anterior lobe of right cerebral ganglion, Peptide, 39 aa] [Lymnaea stagnalis]